MPAPVKHPILAMVGLGVIALLCVQLLRNAITLEAASLRAALTVVVLALVDRVALPLGQAMLAPPATGTRARAARDAGTSVAGREPDRALRSRPGESPLDPTDRPEPTPGGSRS